MTPFCTITPTRGDRPELLEFSERQLDRMTIQPDKRLLANYPPLSDRVDIVGRIQHCVSMAKLLKYDFCFIIEDDDFYPANYFEQFGDISQYDFIGSEVSLYYNIRNNTYERLDHPGRSSLYCTGFRISAIDESFWRKLPANSKFLDIDLWQYAKDHRKRILLKKEPVAVGIKGHGIGMAAGKGHVIPLKLQDKGGLLLQEMVGKEAYEFYSNLVKVAV